ncbi:putative transcriptional regulator [Nocardioides salarius]|uniref:Transcriptional regulator n=1 Tax=Nocardioides salarius TaxID=374513 RepID=A0ABS2MEB9_9ACTN|nr:BlaI/MecI/CopY family transcriptional regulator [Nocardioides salarius]MBM7509529.1 putative transcriptional regulator [Nocardioides salarius]
MRQLGQLEAAVMQRLWSSDSPVSVRQVLEDLSAERALAYTTVMTVLDNLHSKGMVRREKQGRAYLYSPCSTREEHTAALLEQVLADTDDRRSTLVHFVGKMSKDEVDELRAALSDRTEPPT